MAHEYDDSDHHDLDEPSEDDENGFFDLEASEATSDAGSDEDADLDAETATFDSFQFHKFVLLPPELQVMVWKAFCPDLTTASRVFAIHFIDNGHVVLGPGVESQTDPMRTLLAVDNRTRALGHKYSPHRLELPNGCGIIPCHLGRDIVSVTWPMTEILYSGLSIPESISVLARFANGLQNLAFQIPTAYFDETSIQELRSIPSLRNVFVLNDAEEIAVKGLTWCVADDTHEYRLRTEDPDDEIGNPGPDIDSIFCWPDTEKYGDAGEEKFNERRLGALTFDEDGNQLNSEGEISATYDESRAAQWASCITRFREVFLPDSSEKDGPYLEAGKSTSSDGDGDGKKESVAGCRQIQVWPMALFEFEQGIQRFYDMKAWQDPWDDWQSDVSHLSDAEPNEYESDGIDDEPVDDVLTTDDEDDLPAHLLDGFSQASDQMFGNASDVEGLPAAQFSSGSEPEDQGDDGSDASEPDDEEEPRSRHSARRVVESDDSDDSSVTEAGSPPRKTSNRRARAVIDDSDEVDEDEGHADDVPQPGRGPRRRARPIPVDSEDDDDEEAPPRSIRAANRRARPPPVDLDEEEDEEEAADQEEEASPPRLGKRKAHAVAPSKSDSDSHSDDSSDSDESPPPPKRMSLAKRLQMEHRQAQADLPTADSDGSDADGYGGASDDEEGDVDPFVKDETAMDMIEDGEEYEEEDDEGAW